MTIILYTRRNVGLYALSYLIASGYEVKVISDDKNVLWLAERWGIKIVDFDTMGEYDWFICVHGNKIIPKKYLSPKMINVHPCLATNRIGHNPIKGYIKDKAVVGSVSSHWLIEEVDKGEIIHTEWFDTPECKTYADFYNVAAPFYYKCLDKTLEIINK